MYVPLGLITNNTCYLFHASRTSLNRLSPTLEETREVCTSYLLCLVYYNHGNTNPNLDLSRVHYMFCCHIANVCLRPKSWRKRCDDWALWRRRERSTAVVLPKPWSSSQVSLEKLLGTPLSLGNLRFAGRPGCAEPRPNRRVALREAPPSVCGVGLSLIW